MRPATRTLGRRLLRVDRVLRRGRTIAFTEGQLFDGEGRPLAKASATALPTSFAGAVA